MLEDPDDGEDRMRRNPSTAARSNRIRRARAGTETTVEPDEDEQQSNGDFVIRDKSGNYLREVPMVGEADADIEEERKSSLQYYRPSKSIRRAERLCRFSCDWTLTNSIVPRTSRRRTFDSYHSRLLDIRGWSIGRTWKQKT